MNTGVIDRFTEVFTRYIDSGFGLLGGEVAFLASTLIVLDVTLAGLFWAWGANEDVLAHLIKKTLYVGFFAFLIGNFNSLAKIVFNSFSGLGLKATGSGLSVSQFLQPGRLGQVGIEAGRTIPQLYPDLRAADRLAHRGDRVLHPGRAALRHLDRVQAHDAGGLHPGALRPLRQDRLPGRAGSWQCRRFGRQ